MADFDQVSGVVLAADTTDAQQGFFSRLEDAVFKGIPGAAISGALSVYNTFLDYGGKEALDTAEVIRRYDANWGDYYEDHKETADLVGFIGTSFIPGGVGIKGLKLLQSGRAEGAFARATGFAASRKDEYLQSALRELGKSGGTLTSDIAAAKRAQLTWATADNILTSTAAELMIAATMNNSPVLENQSAWDLTQNIAFGALFGGVVGGVLEHAAARGILKQAQTKIEGAKRTFDTLDPLLNAGLTKSDEALNFIEQIVKLPDDYYNTNFSYRKPGSSEQVPLVLETADAFKATRGRTEKVAFDTLAKKFNELAEGGEVTGQSFHKFILQKVQDARARGLSPDDVADEVRGYVQGVSKIQNLTEDALEKAAQPKQFFVNESPTGFNDLFSEVKGKTTSKQAYYLTTEDPTKIRFASARQGFENAQQAFDEGYDAVITKAGKVSVNPKSEVIKRTPDAALSTKFFLDLETGKLSPEIVLTAADLMKKGEDFTHFKDAVRIAGKLFKQEKSVASSVKDSALNASARFMWASKLDAKDFYKRTIDAADFPLLERMAALPEIARQGDAVPSIKLVDGTTVSFNDIVSPQHFVNQLKLEWLVRELGAEAKGYDIRHLAAHLNVERQWVEQAIEGNFAASPKLTGSARQLEKYFQPQTVQLEWDMQIQQAQQLAGPIGPGHQATVLLGHQYALMTRQSVQEDAVRAVFEADADRFMDLDQLLARETTSQGAGAKTFGASNADYGKRAELAVQETGKQVALLTHKNRDAAIGVMAPHINAIRADKQAGAELGVLTSALRRDARRYKLVKDLDSEGADTYRLVDREAYAMKDSEEFGGDLDDAIEYLQATATPGQKIRGEYQIKNAAVGRFLEEHTALNKTRVEKRTVLMNATGVARKWDADSVYVPPIDTNRYPHVAFVVNKNKIGLQTDVSVITGRNDEQLRQLASAVDGDYEVVFKSDIKRFKEAQGKYEYSMHLNESQVNSALERKGVLGDFFPETRGENVLEDFVNFHARAEEELIRTGVQVKNRQFFGELQWLSERWQDATTSTMGPRGFFFQKNVADPFRDYIKTALNISKRSEYPLLDSLNEFVDKVGTQAYKAIDSSIEKFKQSEGKDLVSLEQANKLLDDYGLGTPYKTMEEYLVANERMPKNAIKVFFQKANLFLATATLRLDFANSLVNIISTPIMLGTELSAIKQAMGKNPELIGKLNELTSIKIPGQEAAVPSMTKLIGQAVRNFFGKDKQALLQRYKSNGDIKDVLSLYHEVLEDLSYMPNRDAAGWGSKINAAVEKGARITGNTFSEEFTRFISADVMRQLSDPVVAAGKMSVKEQNAYISSFVNRVQGNYISSQRPVLFQGTTGAAIGLFQTYAFNVLQQLFRHMENRNTKTLLTFAGLQTGVYGMNGLPFFDAINQHLIGNAAGNTGHVDAYSALPMANKELGDWLLYGTASAFPLFGDKMPALYSRGDINPRHISIVPINPLDVPAIDASIKLVNSVKQFGSSVAKGADLGNSMLFALEHHGWNRPLAGFAQLLAGQSTTSKGSLISAANDLETTSMLARIPERLVEFGGAARLMGAKPMDEAVALSTLYRSRAYEAVDRARIESLGQAVKTKLQSNQTPDDEELEDFMSSYVKAGGRQETFSGAMQRWMKDANYSVVNQMADKLTTPSAKRMQIALGGEPIADYRSLAGGEE